MGKFDFNSSRYSRFFSDADVRFLATFITETDALRTNKKFWTTQFVKAANATLTQPDGTATFAVKCVDKEVAPMMDMRMPLGDSTPMDSKGLDFFTGTIPDFIAPGIVEKAQERAYKESLYAQFGNDSDIIEQWVQKVQTQKDSADFTLSNLSAQLLSKGEMSYNFGRGVQGGKLHKYDIPSDNKKTAGTKVWAAADCLLLDQMAKIEQDWRAAKGYEGAMKWQIPYNIFMNVVMKNAQVKTFITAQRNLDYQASTTGMIFTPEQVLMYMALYPSISPVEIIVEKQKNLTWDGATMVNGWASNTVVLRPQGYAGEIQYTNMLDQQMFDKYGSSIVEKQFAPLEGGIYTLVNTTLNNGNYKEWHTDIMMSAIPSLLEWDYHVLVDVATADA